MQTYRDKLKSKKRIVIKIGSSSLVHEETGRLNLTKVEKLVRVLSDLHNEGKDVVLVSSGAIAVGANSLGIVGKPESIPQKQACASIGQAKLMMTYEKLFSEYNQVTSQVLITKMTILNDTSRKNACNTFTELFKYGAIPVVNENDTVSTYEIEFGDNDRLSAIVAALINADLLILLSDIDGLYTDDPNKSADAKFIEFVPSLTPELVAMGKGSSSSLVGTGGMSSKIAAASIANDAGADMVIANGKNVGIINDIVEGENVGTLFLAHKNKNFDLIEMIS